MSAMHRSWFSYGISRPYPFRWFTPVVVIGGILFTILFSVINLATNGYYLKTEYVNDPNATESEKHWYSNPPWSWSDKLKATCQPQNIPIGYQFFTNNSGFSYTVTSVSQYYPETNETRRVPSFQYKNQVLQDCYIDNVILYMRKADQSEAGDSVWWSWDDSSGAATAHCRVDILNSSFSVTFSTTYQSAPKQYEYTIKNDYKNSSSMWWGTRLLNLYWSSTLVEMSMAMYPPLNGSWTTTPIWTKGQMTFTPNVITDIESYDFFDLQYFFIAADASIRNYPYNLTTLYNNPDGLAYSGPLTEGLTWAKIMSSMILTDVGEKRPPNLLLDPTLLQWALQYPDDVFRKELNNYACSKGDCDEDWDNYLGIAAPGLDPKDKRQTPMNQSYDAFKDGMGPLGTENATIYLQYVCSVPERKDLSSLFLAVLIADLVFLQALWTILNFVAGIVVKKQDDTAMACYAHAANQDHELVGMETKLGDGGSSVTSREVLIEEEAYGRNGYLPVR